MDSQEFNKMMHSSSWKILKYYREMCCPCIANQSQTTGAARNCLSLSGSRWRSSLSSKSCIQVCLFDLIPSKPPCVLARLGSCDSVCGKPNVEEFTSPSYKQFICSSILKPAVDILSLKFLARSNTAIPSNISYCNPYHFFNQQTLFLLHSSTL